MEGCQWPTLAEPYRTALREAVSYIFSQFEPAGIIVAGTIIRGNPAPASDLDFHILHHHPVRQRVQQFFNGVPAEIFVNPPERIAGYFVSERIDGRPLTAHMFATGFVVYDPNGLVRDLQARAAEVLAAGPDPPADFLLRTRYAVATWLEDALDIAETDPEGCAALLCRAVEEAIRYRFWDARQWQPRHKELLSALAALDAPLAGHARQFYSACDAGQRVSLATEIVRRSVGATGFFAWESPPEGAD